MVLHCRVSVSPILAHSGSWWIDKKIVKKLGEGQEHFKKRSQLQQPPNVIWATSHMNSLGSNGFSGILWHFGFQRWFKKRTPYEFSLCFNKHSIGKMALWRTEFWGMILIYSNLRGVMIHFTSADTQENKCRYLYQTLTLWYVYKGLQTLGKLFGHQPFFK